MPRSTEFVLHAVTTGPNRHTMNIILSYARISLPIIFCALKLKTIKLLCKFQPLTILLFTKLVHTYVRT